MAACDRYRGNKARVKAFVLVMRYSGLRIGDTVTLRRDRLKDSKLLLYTAKTGTPSTSRFRRSSIETLAMLLGHSDIRVTLKHYRPWVMSLQTHLENEVQKAWATDDAAGKDLESGRRPPAGETEPAVRTRRSGASPRLARLAARSTTRPGRALART